MQLTYPISFVIIKRKKQYFSFHSTNIYKLCYSLSMHFYTFIICHKHVYVSNNLNDYKSEDLFFSGKPQDFLYYIWLQLHTDTVIRSMIFTVFHFAELIILQVPSPLHHLPLKSVCRRLFPSLFYENHLGK